MSQSLELNDRINDLETKITFQDHLIEELNQSIIQQQSDIRKLSRMVEKLSGQLQDIQQPNVLDSSLETPPPHY